MKRTAAVGAALLAVALLGAIPAQAKGRGGESCAGQSPADGWVVVTYNGEGAGQMTNGDDLVCVDGSHITVYTLAGHDIFKVTSDSVDVTIYGEGSLEGTLWCGGTIYGGPGADSVLSRDCWSDLYGRGGEDHLYGFGDVLAGGRAGDTLDSEAGDLIGGRGDDLLTGGTDATLSGGPGFDVCRIEDRRVDVSGCERVRVI